MALCENICELLRKYNFLDFKILKYFFSMIYSWKVYF